MVIHLKHYLKDCLLVNILPSYISKITYSLYTWYYMQVLTNTYMYSVNSVSYCRDEVGSSEHKHTTLHIWGRLLYKSKYCKKLQMTECIISQTIPITISQTKPGCINLCKPNTCSRPHSHLHHKAVYFLEKVQTLMYFCQTIRKHFFATETEKEILKRPAKCLRWTINTVWSKPELILSHGGIK